MSILIRGMEMPKTESEVLIIAIKSDGSVYPVRIDGEGQPMIFPNEEMKNCAVPVPEPHGRLIDADALVDKHFGKEFLTKVMTADEDDLGTALVNVPLVINNAPTIIPAEEGEAWRRLG